MSKLKASWAVAAVVAGVLSAIAAGPAAAQPNERVRAVVAFRPGAAAAMRAAITNAGGRVLLELEEVNAVAVDLPRRAFLALQRSPYAEFVEEDATRTIMRMPKSSSTSRAVAAAGGQTTPYGIAMVQADQVSDANAANRTLCIVDSGIDAMHEDHQGNHLSGFNYTSPISGTWDSDENSHGTHVAGTIAAVNNSVGVVGVMPNTNINIYIAKVFDAAGSAASSTISKAMLGCLTKGHANVISMSLGGSSGSKLEQKVVSFLARRNVLLVAAAGNAGTSAVSYPAGFAEVVSVAAIDSNMAWATFSQFNVDVELAAPGVNVLSTVPPGIESAASLSVGATTYVVQAMAGSPRLSVTAPLADFGLGDTPVAGSMTGKVCLISRGNIAFSDKVLNCQNSGGVGAVIYNNVAGDLFGTLNGVVTAIPSLGALQADGATMLTQLGQSAAVSVFPSTDLYANFSGTSMATPHVSAVAALVWSLHPTCTAAQMRISLNNSAMDLGAGGRDVNFGYGLVQAKTAHDRITSRGCGV